MKFCLEGNIFITAGKATAAACGATTNKLLPERQDYMVPTRTRLCLVRSIWQASLAQVCNLCRYEGTSYAAAKLAPKAFCLEGNIFITAGKATAAACGATTNKLLPERQDYMFCFVLSCLSGRDGRAAKTAGR